MPDEFPTMDSIYAMIKDINIPFDPRIPSLPSFSIPSMPSPMYSKICMPDFQKSILATEMATAQFMNWIKAAFDPIISFLGISFTFPSIPYLNIGLPDLLNPSFDISKLIPSLPDFKVPTLPDPLMPGLTIPEVDRVAQVQALIQMYSSNLLASLTSLISAVVDKLGKKPFSFNIAMPVIPTLPTDFDSLMAPVLAFSGFQSIDDMMARMKTPNVPSGDPNLPFIDSLTGKLTNAQLPSLEKLMSGITIPGFPDLNLAVPDDLFGNFKNPEASLMQMSKNLYQSMSMAALAVIKRFCDAISNFISFSFPKICIPIPTIVT